MTSRWSWVMERPSLILWPILFVTIFFASRLWHLQFDSSPATLILSGSFENQYYEAMARVFGGDQILLIAIHDDDALDRPTLQRILDLTIRLEQIPGIRRVLSLTNVSDVKGGSEEVSISPLVPENLHVLDTQLLRARIQANPLLTGTLVSKDFRTSCLIVFLEDFDPHDASMQGREVTRRVRDAVRSIGAGHHAVIGGLPEMELEGTENMIRDFYSFTPLTLMLVFSILAITFRSLRGVLLPLLVSALTLTWTLGIMTWSGVPLKVSTLVLPSLLISNGCSYAIHLLAQYDRSLSPPTAGRNRMDAIAASLSITHAPILISALTTMAGFGSLALNRIPAIRDLGIFAMLGISLSCFFCVVATPSVLALLPAAVSNRSPDGCSRLDPFLAGVARIVVRRRRLVLGVALAVSACAAAGTIRIHVKTDYLSYFGRNAPIVRAAQEFHERLSGIAPLSIILESSGPRPLTDPEVLKSAERFQLAVGSLPGIDNTLSAIDILKWMNRAFHADHPSSFGLPSESEVIPQLVDLAESDPRGLMSDLLAEDGRSMRIIARTNLFGSEEIQRVLNQTADLGASILPPDVQARVTGQLVLMNRTSDQVAVQQVRSLFYSVLFIAIILFIRFRSWKVGLQALLPAAIPVLLFFGLMGSAGIPLNANTSVIASIAIGIAIDNCIHYITHFQRSRSRGLSASDSTRESLMKAGGPMIAAAAALTLGFLVFGFSQFAPVSHFGFLSAFIMVVNLLADLFLLPALMSAARDADRT